MIIHPKDPFIKELLEREGRKMSKSSLGGSYKELADYIFPRGCDCPDDSGSCDWCHVYYGWFDREQMFALGMEKSAQIAETHIRAMTPNKIPATIRECEWRKNNIPHSWPTAGMVYCPRCKDVILNTHAVEEDDQGRLIHRKCNLLDLLSDPLEQTNCPKHGCLLCVHDRCEECDGMPCLQCANDPEVL